VRAFVDTALPILLPALMTGVILVFARSISDFEITLLLTDPQVQPLTIAVFNAFESGSARHGAAVALTFAPVAAALVLIQTGSLFSALGASPAALGADAAQTYHALVVLGNGFILTAVLWGWALAAIIDHQLVMAGLLFAVASVASLFGVIHSPLASGALFWPWAPPSAVPAHLAGAYGAVAAICWLASTRNRRITA